MYTQQPKRDSSLKKERKIYSLELACIGSATTALVVYKPPNNYENFPWLPFSQRYGGGEASSPWLLTIEWLHILVSLIVPFFVVRYLSREKINIDRQVAFGAVLLLHLQQSLVRAHGTTHRHFRSTSSATLETGASPPPLSSSSPEGTFGVEAASSSETSASAEPPSSEAPSSPMNAGEAVSEDSKNSAGGKGYY